MSTRAPSLGRGCRARRGGVGFLLGQRSPLLFAFLFGEGRPRNGARVLSLMAHLRRSFLLFFIPLEPYPARFARHLPHAGKALCRGYCFFTHACIRSDDMGIALLSQTAHLRRSPPIFFSPLPPANLRPFGAPPSIGRRECPREPLPLEGAAERSEAGLASF